MKIKLEIAMPSPPTGPKTLPCPVCYEDHEEDDECNMGVRQHGPIPEVHFEPTEYVEKVLRGGNRSKSRGTFRKKK